MIVRATAAQKPPSAAVRRSSIRLGRIEKRLTPRPMNEGSTGSRLAEAAMLTSGIRSPPIPIERMNGSRMKHSSASPIATLIPEKIVARPAVSIVRSNASVGSSIFASSSR
jgi:hypothetical protein